MGAVDGAPGRRRSDRPGSPLIAIAMAAVVGTLLGNVGPPPRGFAVGLAGLAALSLFYALRREAVAWGLAGGLLAGLAVTARAPRAPGPLPQPVRFVATIRDGWGADRFGWTTRVRIERLESGGVTVGSWRELRMTVGGEVSREALPGAGVQVVGSGELRSRSPWPLAQPRLSVESHHLLTPAGVGSVVDVVREKAMRRLAAAAGEDPARRRAAGMAAALVLGRLDGLDASEARSLRDSGLGHLLAVSGLNVGMVAVSVLAILTLAGVRPAPARLVVAVSIVGFALLAGGGAPVRRAAAGGVAYLVARALGRPIETLPAVWAIVAGLVLWEPETVLQPGLQLSAVVTLALVRWGEAVAAALRPLPRLAAGPIAVAGVAQTAATPLVGAHFGVVPPLAVVANLLAAPVAFALTAASLVVVALAGAGVGSPALDVVAPMQRALDLIGSGAAVSPMAFPPPPVLAVLVLAVLGAVALTRVPPAGAAACLAVLLIAVWMAWPGARAVTAEVRALGVSDGAAVLIRTPQGALLFDAGRSPDEAARELARLREPPLTALVLTHADEDHLGGAGRLLELGRTRALMLPAVLLPRPELQRLRALARMAGIEEVVVAAGDRLELAGAGVEVLWPPATLAGSDNDASLVTRVMLPESVLLTGDIEAAGEQALLGAGMDLASDVLQLPHHGSRTSSSESFLLAVAPRLAMAATGVRPRFEYPAAEVAQRVRRFRAVLVTQRSGLARLTFAGGRVWVGDEAAVSISLRRRVR